jgi:hypothetical protein
MFRTPELAKALRHPIERTRGDGDIWDGEHLKDWTDAMKKNILPLAFSSDATVLQTWKERSFTPCVVQLLSLPPHLRQTSLGYLLLAVLPPKVRDYKVLYGAMLQYQRTKGLFPEIEGKADPCTDSVPCSPQVEVNDHAEDVAVTRMVRGCINHILEDSRGLCKPICCKSAPAENGMCPFCKVVSVRCKNNKSAAYVCAITHLSLKASSKEATIALREQFYEEHNSNDAVLNRTSKIDNSTGERINKKPMNMQTSAAIAAGRDVEEAIRRFNNRSMSKKRLEEIIKEKPFKGVGAFSEFFGEEWDMIKRIAIDPAHELHNLVKDLLALMQSASSMDFKPKRLAEEQKMHRFSNFANRHDAEWLISERRREILCSLIENRLFLVPESWPKIINYFNDDYDKIKLAESMAFCGDRGAYFLGLTDVTEYLKLLFIELLQVAGGFMKKTTRPTELQSLQERLTVVLAKLEVYLPIYWNTSTRHFLLHMYGTILNLGHFWSISMLGVERLHVLIKTLAKGGTRNLLKTLEKKYSLFCLCQTKWRYNSRHEWTDVKHTFNKKPMLEPTGLIELLGAQHKRNCTDWLFKQLQDQWAIKSKPYDRFRDHYDRYVVTCTERKVHAEVFHKWNPRQRGPVNEDEEKKRDQQLKWQSMERCVWEVDRIKLDGVLFRTERIQTHKGTVTDNSYVIGETFTYGRQNGSRSRSAQPERCYGRIQKIYLHFMYPPLAEDLVNATDKCRIDPYKIQSAPWAVFLKCKWYEESEQNPNNGLNQVRYNAAWTQSCPFIAISGCKAMNCILWPSVPFKDSDYDDQNNLRHGVQPYGVRDYSQELHDVITHHE